MQPDTLDLALRVTLDDQIRFNEWLLDRPELRRKRLLVRGMILVLMPPLGMLFGVGAATLQNGDPLWPALRSAATDPGSLGVAGTVGLAMMLLWGSLRLLRRPLLRRRLRRLLPERPGVDPADPLLAEAVRIRLGPEGFLSESKAITSRLTWAAVKELADTGPLLVLRTGRFSGFLVPKRELAAEQLDGFRAIVAAGMRERA